MYCPFPHVLARCARSAARLLFSNRIVSSCHAKCIQPDPLKGRYAEPELLKGEAVCIDRCTMKFFEVNDKVSQRMQAMGGQAQMAGSFGR